MSRRGSISLYLVAFALLVGSVIGIVVASARFLASLTPLWVSVTCSAAAIAVAIAAVVWPRRG